MYEDGIRMGAYHVNSLAFWRMIIGVNNNTLLLGPGRGGKSSEIPTTSRACKLKYEITLRKGGTNGRYEPPGQGLLSVFPQVSKAWGFRIKTTHTKKKVSQRCYKSKAARLIPPRGRKIRSAERGTLFTASVTKSRTIEPGTGQNKRPLRSLNDHKQQ